MAQYWCRLSPGWVRSGPVSGNSRVSRIDKIGRFRSGVASPCEFQQPGRAFGSAHVELHERGHNWLASLSASADPNTMATTSCFELPRRMLASCRNVFFGFDRTMFQQCGPKTVNITMSCWCDYVMTSNVKPPELIFMREACRLLGWGAINFDGKNALKI